jgi:hypothetical protein
MDEAAEYKNYLARKINGPVAQAMLKASFNCFQETEEWLRYRKYISLETATTQDLNYLGKVIGVPRPYAVIEYEIVYADDNVYRTFLLNVAYLKRSKSIQALGTMLSQFVTTGLFELSFRLNGDIRVVVDSRFEAYLPFLEQVGNTIFTASPRLTPFESREILRFIWDNGLWIKYIQLSDPSVWTWQYDSVNLAEITTTEPTDRIQLEDDPERENYVRLALTVLR